MINIYILYIRSLIEKCCQVWHSSLTQEDSEHLERIQKVALKIILGINYNSYEQALTKVDLQNLSERRDELCLRFAKKCVKSDKTQDMFPINPKNINTRSHEHFKVQEFNTDRLNNSAIPFMQRLLNLYY